MPSHTTIASSRDVNTALFLLRHHIRSLMSPGDSAIGAGLWILAIVPLLCAYLASVG